MNRTIVRSNEGHYPGHFSGDIAGCGELEEVRFVSRSAPRDDQVRGMVQA